MIGGGTEIFSIAIVIQLFHLDLLQTEKYEERTYSNNAAEANGIPVDNKTAGAKEKVPRNARQLWTDDQLAKLARLMNKYPGGTQDRWETIAEAMERYPWEITKMAANVKSSMHMVRLFQHFESLHK